MGVRNLARTTALACTLAAAGRAQEDEVDAGVLPVPDYAGDWATRAFLSGDWSGTRQEWANEGLSFDLNWTTVHADVRSGGLETGASTSTHFECLVQADLMRMGLLPGALITLRTQSRTGSSVNRDTGMPLPVDTVSALPLTSPHDDDVPLAVTDLLYTQFLSRDVGVVIGKAQTLDGDPNEFTSGRGRLQFMNNQFLFNPVQVTGIPYSAPAAGVFWMPSSRLTVSSYLMNTTDASTTTGLDDVGDGTTWNTEVNGQYRLGALPGGMNLGVVYAFDSAFPRTDRDAGNDATESTSWAVYWSGWQYLVAEGDRPEAIQLVDGRADLVGLGVFSRLGLADRETNPLEWSACVGLGGRGPLESRSEDSYGVGYFYNRLQRRALGPPDLADDSSEGLEAYYAFALAVSTHLTLDVQWTRSPVEPIDDAVVFAVRWNIRF